MTIAISVDDDLTIEITDNGVGIPEVIAASGLKNLRSRAKECGGQMTIAAAEKTGGTILTWSAPLP